MKTLISKEENFLPKLGWMTTTLWCFDPVLTKYSDLISEIGGRGVVICYWNWGVIICKIKSRTMRPISSLTQISASHDCVGFSHLILAMLYCSSPWIQLIWVFTINYYLLLTSQSHCAVQLLHCNCFCGIVEIFIATICRSVGAWKPVSYIYKGLLTL